MQLSTRRGFTLIELLIVVAVIAILAGLLFPAFAKARENAKRSVCQGNLKQLGMGLLQYAQDFDESLPVHSIPDISQAGGIVYFADPAHGGWRVNWLWAIQPYTKSWQLNTCPSANAPQSGVEGYSGSSYSYVYDPAYPSSLTTYVANGVVMGRKINVITDTAGIIWAHEWNGRINAAFIRPYREHNGTSFTGKYMDWHRAFLDSAHFDGANLLFCDGHVKWRRQDKVCAADFGLKAATVSGGNACGPNAFGAKADPNF